jgi:murein L,D-transpeptidase YafK
MILKKYNKRPSCKNIVVNMNFLCYSGNLLRYITVMGGDVENMRNLFYFMCVVLLLAAGAGCGGGLGKPETATLDAPLPDYQQQQTQLTPEQRYIAQVLTEQGYNFDREKPTVIVVHKLSRKLICYRGLTPIKTYPVVLGNDPYNDKLCQGDTCTPEGVYRVRAKYPHSKWDSFIWLDYPNNQNWLKFARAKEAGRIPPEADIGGQVGIHGTEDPYRNISGENWTKGCISLLNKDLDEIYPLVNDKTLVVITRQ